MFYCISIKVKVKRDGEKPKTKTKRDMILYLIQEVVDSRRVLKISPQTH